MKVVNWIMLFFGVIGMMTLSVAIHELKHYKDLNEYGEPKEICIMDIKFKDYVGYYSYKPYIDTTNLTFESEIMAYTLTFLVFLGFMIVMFKYIDENV